MEWQKLKLSCQHQCWQCLFWQMASTEMVIGIGIGNGIGKHFHTDGVNIRLYN